MAEQKRIFIAIDISDEARSWIDAYILGLKARSRHVLIKWERPEKLHLTLKFLGSVADERVASIDATVKALAGAFDKFDLTVDGTGVFPAESKPRILWLGIKGDSIGAVAAGIDAGCEQLGFAREQRSFSPHLTIARIKEPSPSMDVVQTHLAVEFPAITFPVTHLTIYESRLLRNGSVYSVVARHPLKA